MVSVVFELSATVRITTVVKLEPTTMDHCEKL